MSDLIGLNLATLVALRDPAGDLGVEPRERDRVGRIDRRQAEPDQVRHQPIYICW